jgi:hypothetical protein
MTGTFSFEASHLLEVRTIVVAPVWRTDRTDAVIQCDLAH